MKCMKTPTLPLAYKIFLLKLYEYIPKPAEQAKTTFKGNDDMK